MVKRIARQILIYLIFILILYVVGRIIKNEDETLHLKDVCLHYFTLAVFTAPSWFGCLFGIRYLNQKAFLLQPFYKRAIRNIFIALILSFISLYLMFYVRTIIYNDPGTEKYMSRYFILFFVNTVIILFVEYYSFYFKSKEEEIRIEREKNQILETRYKVLKEQVNPHFLFNSLNVLSSLIYEDQDKANSYTKQLSKLYRYILSNSEKEEVFLSEEIKFIESYFYILKLRFNDSINLEMKLEEDILENYLIPLSLQVLVENAIKHNSFNREQPLQISITNIEDAIFVKNNKREKNSHVESTGKGLLYLKVLYDRFEKKIEVTEEEKFFIVKLPLLN